MRTTSTSLVLLLGLAASASYGCKRTAEVITEQTVKAAKDTTKGISDGIDKGRKAGESGDGAVIISSPDELRGKGTVTAHAVRRSDAGAATEVDLAVENLGDQPIRLTNLGFQAFDKDGFIKHPQGARNEITVPAHAKEKLTLSFDEAAVALAKVRYWTVDIDLAGVKGR
jgi:hypothetical protein